MLEEKDRLDISESLIFSVSEVTFHLKQVLETQIEALYIVGEISNFIKHNSGHIYFNLKDENAVIRCAFFRNQNYQLDFIPQDGDQVVCFGKITVFEKSGQYQLIVQNMFAYGKGALQQRFEQLKLKLKDEGLFAPEHKKPITKYPQFVGIITSPTGAALQDILNILKRRYPCKVQVFPSLMQGYEAASQVIKGLDYFNASRLVDLIIITRGGGSQEDLFSFNDETLARAIYASELPVVSAIGHEIDFTIADFVADLRAPTPSAAAELITPESTEIERELRFFSDRFQSLIKHHLVGLRNNLQQNQIRLMQYKPERLWHVFQQRFDDAVSNLLRFKEILMKRKYDYLHREQLLIKELSSLKARIALAHDYRLKLSVTRINYGLRNQLLKAGHKLELLNSSLEDLSPRNLLNRGYALVRKNGIIINSINKVKPQDELQLIVSDGTILTGVKSLSKDSPL